MTTVAQQKVYVQRNWTEQALIADGFLSYRPVKRITMVRRLPPEKTPKTMKTSKNTVIAAAKCWTAYVAGDVSKDTLSDYKSRSITPDVFAATYQCWDEPNWHPTPVQSYLRRLGCQPYYEIASVWAKQLADATWVQGTASDEPSLAPKGAWLCVDMEGEPSIMTEAWFQAHYQLPGHINPNGDQQPLTHANEAEFDPWLSWRIGKGAAHEKGSGFVD